MQLSYPPFKPKPPVRTPETGYGGSLDLFMRSSPQCAHGIDLSLLYTIICLFMTYQGQLAEPSLFWLLLARLCHHAQHYINKSFLEKEEKG